MKIAVSGASGYIGHKLVLKFLEASCPVLAVTRCETESLRELKKRYFNLLFICELKRDDLSKMLQIFNPDVVYSTTCCYETDIDFLDKTIDSNYAFPVELLKDCMHVGRIIRFISVGTSLPPNLKLE